MKRILALILTLALLLAGCGGKQDAWQEQYDLGMKHLGQGNYEEAIEAFTAAIEIDPDRQEAYAQRSEAYLRLARRLAEGLSEGYLEIPEIPERPEIGPGGSNPESPQETTTPRSQELPEASTPDTTYDPDEVYTHPRGDDAPDDGSDSPDNGGSDSDDGDSGDSDLAQRIRDLIKKLLEWAEKDRDTVIDMDPEEKDKLEQIPAYEDVVPVEPQLTREEALLDYGFLVDSLREMGCGDVCWEVSDLDDDGSSELLLEVIATAEGFPSQLTADWDTQTLFSFTPTGAAQSSCFCRYSDDSYGFYTGYHTVGNQEETYHDWDGNTWMPTDLTPVEWYTLLFGPDLWCIPTDLTPAAAAAALENSYLNRPGYAGSLSGDLDGDGSREYILLLRGVSNRYFVNLQRANDWGDEPYLEYSDLQISAVVVSESGGQTWLRSARLDSAACEDVHLENGGLYIDGMLYSYHADGTPLVPDIGEIVIADNILDLGYFQVAIPDSWEGRYAYDILENPYLDGIPERYWVTFYERQEYEACGCGVLFEIVMVLEGTDFDHPAADLMGIYYYGSPADPNCLIYSVYACYPTDVQFTEENADAYLALSQDIYNVLLSFDAGEYCYFHSYYTDTH